MFKRRAHDIYLLHPRTVRRLGRSLGALYSTPAVVTCTALSVVVLVLASRMPWSRQDIDHLGIGLAVLALLVGLLCHEMGHAAAALRQGRGVRFAGVTLYRNVLPAFFVDIAPARIHDLRAERLIDLAGLYIQLVFAAVLASISLLWGQAWCAAGAALLVIEGAWQLMPIPGQDGHRIWRHVRPLARTKVAPDTAGIDQVL